MSDTRIYVALTSEWGNTARKLLEPLAGLPVGVKVGLELFVREGPGIVEELRSSGFPVFLDLKFHDIPHTVAGAVRSACALEPEIINVHGLRGKGNDGGRCGGKDRQHENYCSNRSHQHGLR